MKEDNQQEDKMKAKDEQSDFEEKEKKEKYSIPTKTEIKSSTLTF
jgi:hypothetical protein